MSLTGKQYIKPLGDIKHGTLAMLSVLVIIEVGADMRSFDPAPDPISPFQNYFQTEQWPNDT